MSNGEQTPKVWIRPRKTKSGKITYHLRWVDPASNKWKSEKAGTDEKRARGKAAKREEELSAGSYRSTRRIDWAAFVADHVSKIEGVADKREAELALTQFGECNGSVSPRRATFGMIEKFVAWLREGKESQVAADGTKIPGREKNSQATINKKLRYVRHAFAMAIKRGFLARSPMEGWKWVAEDEPEPRIATDAEETALLTAAEELYGYRMRAFIEVALATGGRRGEVTALEWNRIDLERGEVLFTHTKSKRNRTVPIMLETIAVLNKVKLQTQLLPGPFTGLEVNIWHKWPKILERAGIAHITIHDLRRTFVTRLVRAGVPLTTAKELAGHRKIQTTERYYTAVTSEDCRKAIGRITRVG